MTQEQLILFKRSINIYNTETEAWTALDNLTHTQGQPVVAFFRRNSNTHGDTALGAIFAIGTANGVGKYKACSSHDDMLAVAQALNTHISEWTAFKATFDKMFEYDAGHEAIKAKLDFYTDSNKNISAGGLGGSGSSSLGALYQLVDVMINSTGDGVEGAVEGSVLAYDATAGKWKAIAQSEILPDMSGYYTKDETDSAINTAKSNLQGQFDTLKALIPATATSDNQLADKDFVNSSIATATAEFRGSFTSLDELKATSGNLNDYAFYLHNDSVGNSIVDRYKWTTAGWLYEYTLNNSSFTAEQWAALNSTITATLVQSYNSHLNNSTIHITAAERTAWNNKWDYNEEIIKAVKVNAAVLSDSATKLATARKIWGKYFDGLADVSGDLTEVGNITASGKATIQGDIICGGEVVAVAGEASAAGVTDYSALTGKPQINGVTLVSGNNTLASLGIQAAGDYATNSGVATLLANYADKTFVSNNYVGKTAFNNHTADTDIHITSAERVAWNAKWNYNEDTIKAVKVNSASSADSVAWSGIKNKPTTFTPSAHTHTASDVSGLPTSLKNPFALTFGSKTYDGSAAATITASDLGALTSITKSMVEGVLTGNITSHTHTFASLTSKPTTIAGYGITDALTTSNYNSYAPTLTGTGASGTWGINISGNAASADVIAKTYANQSINFTHDDSKIRLISITNGDASGNGFPNKYVGGISVISSYVGWQMVSYANWAYPNPYFRHIYDNDNWSDWKQLAFLTDNVASATKLANSYTIFGRPFNGTAKVSEVVSDIRRVIIGADLGDWDGNRAELELITAIDNPNDFWLGTNSQRDWCLSARSSADGNALHLYNRNLDIVATLNQNGNILIGTITDNGYKLQVNGSERVYGDLIVDGEVSALVA